MPNIKTIKAIVPERALFAVSMGVDSFAGYHYLKRHCQLVPIHFNHGLRPQNDLAAKAFVECVGDESDVGQGSGLKTENDCRNARLEFYRKMAQKHGIRTVITAHHMDDWIENYLLNCFRGQPDRKPFNLLSEFGLFNIIHPFLLSCKASLIQYALRNELFHLTVHDETNYQIKGSRRNWIRNVIVPELTKQEISLRKHANNQIMKELNNYEYQNSWSHILR